MKASLVIGVSSLTISIISYHIIYKVVDELAQSYGEVPRTTTQSIGAFSDLVSFSTRIKIPGLLVGKATVISRSGKLLDLFDPLLCLRVLLEKVHCRPAAR